MRSAAPSSIGESPAACRGRCPRGPLAPRAVGFRSRSERTTVSGDDFRARQQIKARQHFADANIAADDSAALQHRGKLLLDGRSRIDLAKRLGFARNPNGGRTLERLRKIGVARVFVIGGRERLDFRFGFAERGLPGLHVLRSVGSRSEHNELRFVVPGQFDEPFLHARRNFFAADEQDRAANPCGIDPGHFT